MSANASGFDPVSNAFLLQALQTCSPTKRRKGPPKKKIYQRQPKGSTGSKPPKHAEHLLDLLIHRCLQLLDEGEELARTVPQTGNMSTNVQLSVKYQEQRNRLLRTFISSFRDMKEAWTPDGSQI